VGPAIKALAAAGWQHQGDLGVEGREAFLPAADAAYHHLYLVVAGSQPYRDHIDFRDFLRTHPGRAARYGEVKRRLAVLLETDREAYVHGKAEMITEFLRLARSGGTSEVSGSCMMSKPWTQANSSYSSRVCQPKLS
jgi:GrpB-like predicted nucleotidyltransferase (UPF0157 family)